MQSSVAKSVWSLTALISCTSLLIELRMLISASRTAGEKPSIASQSSIEMALVFMDEGREHRVISRFKKPAITTLSLRAVSTFALAGCGLDPAGTDRHDAPIPYCHRAGNRYQRMMNEALKAYLSEAEAPDPSRDLHEAATLLS